MIKKEVKQFFQIFFKYFRLILLNKYSITLIAFVVYMTFFDDNNWIKKHQRTREIKQLEIEYQHYIDEIEQNKAIIYKLHNDTDFLEKYAREHYYMKRSNEDIFLLR